MLFTIKDIENLSGIKAHTIRIWEQRYNFIKPSRSTTNIRYYTADELRTILNVSLLCKHGFRVSDINNMGDEALVKKVLSLSGSGARQGVMLNKLLEAMVTLNVKNFEVTLDNYIAEKGLEKAVLQLIFPFLDKVGMLWLANDINATQEKLASNIIRQKLLAAIDRLPYVTSTTVQACLFLPECEYNELSLLFIYFLLKKAGFSTIYLGQNVSFKELEKIVSLKKPAHFFTHICTGGPSFNIDDFITTIKKEFRDASVVISGQQAIGYEKKIPLKIHLKRSLTEVKEFINDLKNK